MWHIEATFKIGSKLREEILRRQRENGLSDGVPGIILASSEEDAAQRLMLGFYDRMKLPIDDPVWLVSIGKDMDLLIIQEDVMNALEGNFIDIVDGRLAILPS